MRCRRCPRNCKRRAAVHHVTGATRLREGRTAATTREPGDLPRQHNVHGRGVPVVRATAEAVSVRTSLQASAMALPPTSGLEAMSIMTSCRYARLSPHRPAPRTETRARKLLGRKVRRTQLCSRPPPACAPPLGAAERRSASIIIPSNDFSLYDQVLDTSVMVGAIPTIYGWNGGAVALETYFAMARGAQGDDGQEAIGTVTPMTAWRAGAGNDQMV